MIKIYWHPLSPPSNKVLFCANLLHLEYEKVLVDLAKGEQAGTGHLQRNPFGKVPVIDDDGFILYESDAIMRYLARCQKSDLYPSKYKERALVDQWCDFSSFMLQIGVQKLFFHRLIAPMIGESPNEEIIQQGLTQVDAYLPVYDKHLATTGFMCGSALTLADLALLGTLDPAEAIGIDLSKYPTLHQWRENLRKQDFYQQVHDHYGQGIIS